MFDFPTAVRLVKSGKFAATDSERLELYALYKIGTDAVPQHQGGGSVLQPARTAMRASWERLRCTGMTCNEARRRYVQLTAQMIGVPELSPVGTTSPPPAMRISPSPLSRQNDTP